MEIMNKEYENVNDLASLAHLMGRNI